MKVFVNYNLECGHVTPIQILMYDDWDTYKLFTLMKPVGEKFDCDTCKTDRKIRSIRISQSIEPKGPTVYPPTQKFENE